MSKSRMLVARSTRAIPRSPRLTWAVCQVPGWAEPMEPVMRSSNRRASDNANRMMEYANQQLPSRSTGTLLPSIRSRSTTNQFRDD